MPGGIPARPLQTRGGPRSGRGGAESGGRRNVVSRGNPAATGLSGTSEPLTDREKDFEGLKDLSESESKEPQSSRSKKRESSKEPRSSKTPSRQAEGLPDNWSNKEDNSMTSNFRGQEEGDPL